MDKTIKWLIIVVVIIGLIIVAVLIVKAAKPGTTTILDNVFSGGGFSPSDCDPNRPGYTKDGKKDTRCEIVTCDPNKCDPNKPGYDDCGFPNVNCGFGRLNK